MTADDIREQVPHDARLFPLIPNTKRPRSEHAHLDAVPREDFLELYVSGNYGISLDRQYLLVDKDRDDDVVSAFEARLPETWMQKTWRRGTHRLYRVPADFAGRNGRWPGGELKVNGYLVGPGSVVKDPDGNEGTYALIDGREPAQAPSWLLDMVSGSSEPVVELVGAAFDQIRDGYRDNELASIGGFLRHKNYSEQMIAASLAGLVNSGVVEQPPGREVTAHDIARIAKSVARYTPATEVGAIADASWRSAENVRIVGPPFEWWMHGFIPKRELVMIFGDGGVGKSSLGSWIATQVLTRGGAFLWIGTEEPFERFVARALIGVPGLNRNHLIDGSDGPRIRLPDDVPALREKLAAARVSVVYFDKIASHFTHIQGEISPDRARRCLSPLAEMAQEDGITVIGVFHTTKDGNYEGSTEMVNIARVVLQVERESPGPLTVNVFKTNIFEPGYAATFEGILVPYADPDDPSKVQYDTRDDGTIEPLSLIVAKRGPNIANAEQTAMPAGGIPLSIIFDPSKDTGTPT